MKNKNLRVIEDKSDKLQELNYDKLLEIKDKFRVHIS
jgi:hypothetical protein